MVAESCKVLALKNPLTAALNFGWLVCVVKLIFPVKVVPFCVNVKVALPWVEPATPVLTHVPAQVPVKLAVVGTKGIVGEV